MLTLTMMYAAIAPEAARRSTYGAPLSGPVAHVVVRNWTTLIGLMNGMLIHAARPAEARPSACRLLTRHLLWRSDSQGTSWLRPARSIAAQS
jgi:hypothetical protein